MSGIATVFAERSAFHGEGPVWDSRRQRLLHVDMLVGDVVDLGASGTPERHPVGTIAAVVRARRSGGFVLALEYGFALVDDEFRNLIELPRVIGNPGIRMNDGGCDPQGRFYCGSMAYDETPGAGTLYRLDADLTVHTALDGVSISNGLQWSADGERVFYVDTPTGRVDVFDFDASSGAFLDRQPFASIPERSGFPDGMAIDAEDGLWVALWGGAAVHRFDADGALSEVIELPVSNVTACAFGGDDLRTLFVTTSRDGIAEGAEPLAGSVFRVDAGVTGAPQHLFAG